MKNIYEEFKKNDNGWHSEKLGEVDEIPVFVRSMKDCEANYHTHKNSDEMFIVVDGELFIDLEKETVNLSKGQSFTVKAGCSHRSRAPEFAKLIVIGGK